MHDPENSPETTLHVSRDGSHTVYSDKFNQFYHNPNGAIAESRHVFFDTPGWIRNPTSKATIHILEVGFGTGLNLLLLIEQFSREDRVPDVTFRSVEAYPLDPDQAMSLNYPELIDVPDASEMLASVFRGLEPGMNTTLLNENIKLELFFGRFNRMSPPAGDLDIIFFDPFSPDVNPELWTRPVFRQLADWSDPDVLLCTYGASSAARAAMAAAGWYVARAKGALGKREMTLAALNPSRLNGWKRVNEKRLAKRFNSGEFGSS